MIKKSNTPQRALDRIEECRRTKNRILDLSGLGLTKIPMEIAEFTWLTELLLSDNQVIKIECISKLTNLTELDISFNQLIKIECISSFTNLMVLSLNSNQIPKIEGLTTLTNLTELSLNGNQIPKIEGLRTLTNLTELGLFDNQIHKIEGLRTLTNLTKLSLDFNQIHKIEGLTTLTKLMELVLSNNQIQKIEGLSTLTNLTRIDLDNNQISDIAHLLPFIHKGFVVKWNYNLRRSKNSILIKDNPLITPDIETVQRGNEAILAYFAEKEAIKIYEEQKNVQNEVLEEYPIIPSAKVVLFGNSNVGKTDLSKYLRTGIFDKNYRNSTHGILIDHWNINSEIIASIWDFGGQEYYHNTFRLFLSNNALFIILWEEDTNKNIPKAEILINSETKEREGVAHFHYEYWLDNINHYATGKKVILLVQNKVDTYEDKGHIEADLFKTYNITDDYAISIHEAANGKSKQHRHLENFKIEFIEHLNTLVTDGERGQSRSKLRDYLIDLQEDRKVKDNPFLDFKDELFISFEQFEKILPSMKIDYDLNLDSREAADMLHTKGIILFYQKNPKLNDKVFLQPKKMVDAIYDVLSREVKDKYKGQFLLEDIDIENKEVVIALMEQMGIVFKVEKQGKVTYIAPQYLPEEHEIEALYQIAEDGIQQSGFSVKLPLFYYRRALQQLILYYGKNQEDATKSYFWKHGILIQKDGIRLLIKGLYPQVNESEGVLTIATDKKSGYLELQKEIFKEILSISHGWIRVEMAQIDENYDGPDDDEIERFVKEDMKNNPENYTFSISKEKQERLKRTFEEISEKAKKINKRIDVSTDGEYFTSYTELLAKAEQNDLKIEGKNKENKTKLLNINNFQMMLDKTVERPLKVFISYSHKDMTFKNDLYTHLSMLRNSQKIETWDDGEIIAGQEWNETILNQLRNADVILLLLSSDAIASKYIWEKEIKIALEKRAKGNLVIPIYVRSFDIEGLNDSNSEIDKLKQAFITQLQWLPTKDGKLKAVSKWEDKDDALTEVAKEIRKAIENYKVGKG